MTAVSITNNNNNNNNNNCDDDDDDDNDDDDDDDNDDNDDSDNDDNTSLGKVLLSEIANSSIVFFTSLLSISTAIIAIVFTINITISITKL